MVNQLLAGVHIASGAEAMAFGARLGLNTRMLFDVITNSGGTSWYASLLSIEIVLQPLLPQPLYFKEVVRFLFILVYT